MHVLVLGGTGLIGKPFCKALVAAGHRVTVVSRHPDPSRVPPGVEIAPWDGPSLGLSLGLSLGSSGWADRLESADAVVNLAGENIGASAWTAARKEAIRASRVQAGQAVVAAFRSAKVRPSVLIQASAVGYYGISLDRTLTEESPAGDDYLSGICLDWEASTRPVEELGVRRIIARTGIVLTPQGGVLPRLMLPFRLFAGGRMGSGKQWMSWIHIQDEVRALLFLLENPSASGAYNLAAPGPVTNAEFGRILAMTIRRPYWATVPAFALRLVLGEMSTLILDGQRVVPERLSAAGFKFSFDNLSAALQNLL